LKLKPDDRGSDRRGQGLGQGFPAARRQAERGRHEATKFYKIPSADPLPDQVFLEIRPHSVPFLPFLMAMVFIKVNLSKKYASHCNINLLKKL
jgi:hypothetical protein